MKRDKTAVFQPHSDKVSDTAAVPQNTNEGSVFCFKSQGERDQRLHPFKNPKGRCERKKIRSPCMTYCITDAEGECMASVIPRMESWAVGRRMIHSAWVPLSPTGVGVKLELGEGAGSYC